MNHPEPNNYMEDDKQTDALAEFGPKIKEILERYRDERQLSAVAQKIGVNAARLTEMITTDEKGQPNRRVTPYYLAKFIESGIMSVEEILDGKTLTEVSDRARLFLERMILSRKTIQLVYEAQERGINVDELLKVVLSQKL